MTIRSLVLAALCGVLTYSLCMDDSLATDELPDCPKCKRKLANKQI